MCNYSKFCVQYFQNWAVLWMYSGGRSASALPGPRGLPFLGSLLDVDTSRFHHVCSRWSRHYGKIFQFRLAGQSVVVVTDAGLLRRLFATGQISHHTNDRADNVTKHVFYGRKHIGFADLGERTNELRSILRRKVLNRLMCDRNFENTCFSIIDKLAHGLNHESVNPDTLIKDVIQELNSFVLIGEALPADDPDKDALWEFIERLYDLLQPAVDVPLRMFPWLRFLPFKHGRLFRAAIESRDRVSRKYFDTQKASYEAGRVRGLVDVCLQIQAEEGTTSGDQAWLSDDYIRGLMFDTVLAGMSEMMKSMRMLILLMCHYPHVQSRVHAEINDVIGTSAMPSSNHRMEMPYTQAVLLEMLRYVSQTPLAIPHKCNKDVVLDGFVIEKDSGIFPNIFGIHHDEAIWGDPWCFRPERFLTHDGYSLLPEDHKLRQSLIPFSVGRRRCPGEDFAMTRLFLVLTSLIQKLHFLPPSSGELPSADPRLYNNQYPLYLPVFTCKAVRRPVMDAQTESQS
ncbi:vitamin D 25-hydroxylase-like isoform X3 [Mya arenaria]|uniref:vitamin D 25-hydroxylase-like isoform X3 n=1 Tax=Mya arenaria TaxID=6604 RepID=UPI0022E1E05C|nr:vitamin D 25-hydroxylase-like isoform X3 [Mya arenaria]